MDSQVEAEMPKYKCHKEVWALKISAIEFNENGDGIISFTNHRYDITKIKDYRQKFKGNENDLGYYIIYDDGYTSWSPSKAFEDGYSLIGAK